MKKNPILIITAKPKTFWQQWQHIKQYKQLLFDLAYKDIKVKYAQTIGGVLLSFINPIFTTIAITFIFKKVGAVKTGDFPHTLFTLVGMIGWVYISSVVQSASTSLIGAQDMIKKIYFPRIYIPLSKAVAALVSLGIMFICLLITMMIYNIAPSPNIIYLPIFLMMAVITALGVSIWISALSIRFRDLIHTVPLILRLGMFVTPIAYSAKQIGGLHGWIKFFYFFNPLVGVIESIRWSILGFGYLHQYTFISFSISVILLITGLRYFFIIERKMADII